MFEDCRIWPEKDSIKILMVLLLLPFLIFKERKKKQIKNRIYLFFICIA